MLPIAIRQKFLIFITFSYFLPLVEFVNSKPKTPYTGNPSLKNDISIIMIAGRYMDTHPYPHDIIVIYFVTVYIIFHTELVQAFTKAYNGHSS